MPKTRFNYAVVLHPDVVKSLADDPISGLLQGNNHFNCSKIDPDGAFLHLTVERKKMIPRPIAIESVDLLIPHSYVRYIMSFPPGKMIGFFERDQQSKTTTS